LTSILHVSDVHFGPKHLPALSRAVLDLVRTSAPAALVVSGDLTQRAKPHQFAAARDWIESIPCPVVFVPGNHDVPMYRFWERLFSPFGAWRRHFSAQLWRDHVDAEVAIVGINTAFNWTTKHGRVPDEEIARAEERFASAPVGAARVLVAHHPLAPATELGSEPVASGAGRALALCDRLGVELVLTGHLHHAFWHRPAPEGPIFVQCGTTTSSRGRGAERGRNSLCRIEIGPDSIRLERRCWRSGPEGFALEGEAEWQRRSRAEEADR
jgi:3',5'-cyclic AMP phosphodiesterase CpdA